jgi:hypothetical protein
MNQSEFVKAIAEMAIRVVADEEVAAFLDPPGRRPDPALLELSAWFKGLSSEDRVMVHRAMEWAARSAVFRCLVALDNMTKVTDEEGEFELRFVRKDGVDILAGPLELESLHDLLE